MFKYLKWYDPLAVIVLIVGIVGVLFTLLK